jgi:hypothetical protein
MLDTALLESARKGGRRKGQRTARDLNTNQIKALEAGIRVAENLWIQVTPRGSKSWLMQWMANGKRCYIGLGSYPEVIWPMTTASAQQRDRLEPSIPFVLPARTPALASVHYVPMQRRLTL